MEKFRRPLMESTEDGLGRVTHSQQRNHMGPAAALHSDTPAGTNRVSPHGDREPAAMMADKDADTAFAPAQRPVPGCNRTGEPR